MRILAITLLGLVVAVIGWIAWEVRSDRRYLNQYRPPTVPKPRDRMPPMD